MKGEQLVLIKDPVTGRRGHWVTMKQGGSWLHIFVTTDGRAKRKKKHSSRNPYATYEKSELRQAIKDMESVLKAERDEIRQAENAAREMSKGGDPLLSEIRKRGGIRSPKKGQAYYAEWKERVGAGVKRSVARTKGRPLDEMADEMHMSANSLLQRLQNPHTGKMDGKQLLQHMNLDDKKRQIKELEKEIRRMKAAA